MPEARVKIPKKIAVRPDRPAQDNIPQSRGARNRMWAQARAYIDQRGLVPPIPINDLKIHAENLVKEMGDAYAGTEDFAAVLINNESWRDVLAGIPFERRLLLMPVCLRYEKECPAPFDELGLLCKECGQCSIHDFKLEAERLGYPVLIAEGTPIVRQLIETGQIQAVVGVSCLNVLERVFPYMEAAAVPGIAVPLLQDDCKDTNIDIEWLWDVLHLTSDDRMYRMDLNGLRSRVDEWFTTDRLSEILGTDPDDATAVMGRDWLARSGKRWRPFLTAAMYSAISNDPDTAWPTDLAKLSIAVECFHKASLIHDDIEDDDDERYGEPTMHAEHGVGIAINVGDYLLGEGYRLIAETDADPEQRSRMMHVAAIGHRALSLGQGAELAWSQNPEPMRTNAVLNIFKQKTAPAFEVALRIGAIYGGADDAILDVIGQYSEALGVAYQIRDDIEDILGSADSHDARDTRPSLLLALAHEKSEGSHKDMFAAIWRRQVDFADIENELCAALEQYGIHDRANELLDAFKEEAVRALGQLDDATVKGLLRRVLGRIFDDVHLEALCSSFTSVQPAETSAIP